MADSDTKLLLHFNGNDGATSTHDSSKFNHIVDFFGNAQLDTAQHMFDTKSALKLDGNDNVRVPHSLDWCFYSGRFAIDAWVRFQYLPSNFDTIAEHWWETSNPDPPWYTNWFFDVIRDGLNYRLRFGFTTDGSAASQVNLTSNIFALFTGVWYHFAVTRVSSQYRFFVNGQLKGVAYNTGIIYDSLTNLYVGWNPSAADFGLNGWIDELRISKGATRWTGSFTPPSEEYDTVHLPGQASVVASLTGSLKGITTHLIGWSYPVLTPSGVLDLSYALTGVASAQLFVYPARLSGIIVDLSGFVVGSSNVAAVGMLLGIATELEGSAVCTSSVEGALKGMSRHLAGSISCQSVVTAAIGEPPYWGGGLHVIREVVGAVEAESTVVGLLSSTKRLATSVAASSSVTGRLAVELVGAVVANSSTSGALKATKKLVGTIACQSSISGKLYISLRGRVIANSSITGSIKVARELVGAITAHSSATGSMGVGWSLACAISPNSAVSGRVRVSRRVAGQVSGSSSVTGTVVPFKMLAGTIEVNSTVWCSYQLKVSKKLSGRVVASGTITGLITRYKSLAAVVTAESNLAASLVIEVWLVGSVTPISTVEGHLSLSEALRGLIRARSGVNGLLGISCLLAGEIVAVSTVSGTIIFRVPRFVVAGVVILPIFEHTMLVKPALESSVVNLPVLTHAVGVLPVLNSLMVGLPLFTHATRINEKLKQTVNV